MRMFLAGISTLKNNSEIDNCLYVLESFIAIKTDKVMKSKIKSKTWKMFLLDSGAFTFMSKQNKGSETVIDWDKYIEEYAKFIVENDVQYFFELDIDSLIGLQEVERLRNKLEFLTKRKCIPVWHVSRGKDKFIEICKQYDYVSVGGILTDGVSGRKFRKHIPWIVRTAHKYNAEIHLLGVTEKNTFKTGCDSSDSTSWLSGGRFGTLYHFNGKTMEGISYKNRRIKSHKDANVHNLKEWTKYQKYLDKN